MNERAQMMNQKKVGKHNQPMAQMMSQPMPQLMNQPQMLNQPPPPPSQMMPIMNRSYRMWTQPQPMNPAMEHMAFQNPFNVGKPPGLGRSNWKGKIDMNNQNDLMMRRNEQPQVPHNQLFTNVGGNGGYQPPALLELQSQNRNKARKYYHPKKKFNTRFAPYAPRNTSSFIIRAKKSGGIASLVSPCPVTPAVLPTPVFSPSREVLGDIAKEEWGVDGYGSMKGLIRLRSPGSDGDEDEEEDGLSESDVEEHVEVERRLDHDLSRFEMIYPNGSGSVYNNLLENRVDDQDTHIAQLEEENLTLKERLFLMEREMGDLRKRLQSLERLAHVPGYATEEVVENGSDNDAESNGRGEDRQIGVGYNEDLEYVDECRRDDHGYQKGYTKTVAKALLENEDGQNPNNTIESDGEDMEKKVESDINMEEFRAAPEQDIAHRYVCADKIMEQTIDVGNIKEEVIGDVDGNVKQANVVGAENSEKREG